jgi:quinol monooxygenase YgiN
MIHVVARVTLKPGMAASFLREFRELANLVRQEAGCLDYFPTRDVNTGLPNQKYATDSITILEKWSNRQAPESHLRAGHMRGFQDRVASMVTDVSLTIVEEV